MITIEGDNPVSKMSAVNGWLGNASWCHDTFREK